MGGKGNKEQEKEGGERRRSGMERWSGGGGEGKERAHLALIRRPRREGSGREERESDERLNKRGNKRR